MANLAGERGRVLAQGRITTNRDAVLPTRRNTEAPAVAIRADMRTASRGDGGAQELRQMLDRFTDGVAAAGNAKTAADMDGFRQDAADGKALALTAEELTPEQAQSVARREAFYSAKAEARFNAFSTETKAAAEDAVNQGLGPDEVEELVTQRFQAFTEDLRDTIGSPTAQRDVFTRLGQLGGELDTQLSASIRERTRQEFVTTAQGNIQTALRSGQPVTFEAYVGQFRQGGLDPAAAKRAAIDAVAAVALDRDDPNPELLDALLNSTQADGKTPSLSAAEQLQIEDRVTQANSLKAQVEREAHEEARDDLLEGWLPRVLDGEAVEAEVIQAGRDGKLTAQEVVQYVGLVGNLRDAPLEGHEDTSFVLEQTQKAAMGNPPSNGQLLQWHREGRFGTGRAAQRAMIRLLQDTTTARRAGGGSSGGDGGDGSGDPWMTASQVRNRTVATSRGMLWEQTRPDGEGPPSQYQGEMLVMQDREFNTRVRRGEDPLTVAQSLIQRNRSLIQGDRAPRAAASTTTNRVAYDANGNRIP